MSFFLQVALSGLALGCIYGLVALGVVVIFSATRLLNFAQGEFLMLGRPHRLVDPHRPGSGRSPWRCSPSSP